MNNARTGAHVIGEACQVACLIVGALVILITLIVGMTNILLVLLPPGGEVTIEQAK